MLLCVLDWVSQGRDSEIEISVKEVYWEYSMFQGQPFGGREGEREAEPCWKRQRQDLICDADLRDLVGSSGAGLVQQSCPDLRQRAWPQATNLLLDVGCLGCAEVVD